MPVVNPFLVQHSFRGRFDDGGEAAATWKDGANVNWVQIANENFRVRFLIKETNGGGLAAADFQLQYDLNGGGWNPVSGTSSVVRASASSHFSDGDHTTQQLGVGTFIASNNGMDENDGRGSNVTFAGNDEVEVEYCLQILAGDVVDNDLISLRVVASPNAALDLYSNSPVITVQDVVPVEVEFEPVPFSLGLGDFQVGVGRSVVGPPMEIAFSLGSYTARSSRHVELHGFRFEVRLRRLEGEGGIEERYLLRHERPISFEDLEQGRIVHPTGKFAPGRAVRYVGGRPTWRGHRLKERSDGK